MNLILKIIDSRNFDPNGNNIKEFHAVGGSIGRGENNDFVLPDHEKMVSKLHAFIHYRNEQYHLTDVSTNGVFINEESTPVAQTVDNPRVIQEGDHIQIGPYLLFAALEEDAETIINEIKAEKDSDLSLSIEALLSSEVDGTFLPNQRAKIDNRIDGQFGGVELHQKLGIENTTREAKHVAGDLNIDDFLKEGFDAKDIPSHDVNDLLDLDSLGEDDFSLLDGLDIPAPPQNNLATDKTQRLAALALQLVDADESEHAAILAEISRLSK